MEPQQKRIEFYIAPLSKRFGWRRFSIRQGFIDFPAKSNGQAFFALVNGSKAGGSDTVHLHVFDCSAFFSRNSPRCRSPPFVGLSSKFYQMEVLMMNRANLPDQDPRPKRRRTKDNPYILSTVGIKTNQPHYYVSFPDAQGNQIRLEVPESVYKLLDEFELEDLSFLNEVDNHYDRSVLTEASIEKRVLNPPKSVEESVFENIQNQALYQAILKLPQKQRKRLVLYFFEGFTYREIGDLEGCSYQVIQRSINSALKKIKIFLK